LSGWPGIDEVLAWSEIDQAAPSLPGQWLSGKYEQCYSPNLWITLFSFPVFIFGPSCRGWYSVVSMGRAMGNSQSDSQQLDFHVGHLFATPVIAAMLPDAEARNQDLRQRILAQRERESSVSASNLGGWHSGQPIEQWGGPRIQEIMAAARQIAARSTFDRNGQPVDVDWAVRAWANVNEYGHANAFHYHAGAYWSGTYYVDDGGRMADESLGGEFEVMDPRGPGAAMYAPFLSLDDGAGGHTGASPIQFTPRPGLLMLFPAWLLHQVRPYLGRSQRISIAFNLRVGEHP
jgi:uncharacterized protein (TIGR02466 family)